MKAGGFGLLLGVLFLLMVFLIATFAVPLMMSQSYNEAPVGNNPMDNSTAGNSTSPFAVMQDSNNSMMMVVMVILIAIDLVLGLVALALAGMLLLG